VNEDALAHWGLLRQKQTIDNENKFHLDVLEKRLNCLSTLSIGNDITRSLSYEEARRAKNIRPKYEGMKILQRCIRQSYVYGTVHHLYS